MIFKNKAELFADVAHSSINQKRKYTDYPYIVHPRNVAYLVKAVGGTEDMISAAYLHDVLEDVAPKNPMYNAELIRREFGNNVLEMVISLSDFSTPADGNRAYRKQKEREKLKASSPEVMTIKIADLIDNSLTICEYDPDFAKVYLAEKRLLLSELKCGDPILWYMAHIMLIKRGY